MDTSTHHLPSSFNCSSFTWTTYDGCHLLGRTYDQLGTQNSNCIAVIPRRFRMRLELGDNTPFYSVTRFACVGMTISGTTATSYAPILIDGINEAGVAGSVLNYPDYSPHVSSGEPDQSPLARNFVNVHPGFLAGYLLGQCASIAEIADILASLNLTNPQILDTLMTVHYMFTDMTGETIVIEPDADGLHIYRDTIGVMTNNPGYPWHLTNLRNYISVSNLHSHSRDILGVELSPFGVCQGGGFGLPGDYSSPSRFVRLSMIKNYAVKGNTETDGVSKMFHVFSCVDVPEGILKFAPNLDTYEQTLCTSVICLESRTYYFSASVSRRVFAVRLTPEIYNTEVKYFPLPDHEEITWLN